jgi:hypothetical protein
MCMIYCRKGNTNDYALTGKWQEVKLRTYILDSGKILYDTTYLKPFTNLDYVEFKAGDSCALSSDYHYYINSPSSPKTPQLMPQNIISNKYTALGGGKFVINTQSLLLTPAGFVSADTIFTDNSNNLIIHNVFYSHEPGQESVTDEYYQK